MIPPWGTAVCWGAAVQPFAAVGLRHAGVIGCDALHSFHAGAPKSKPNRGPPFTVCTPAHPTPHLSKDLPCIPSAAVHPKVNTVHTHCARSCATAPLARVSTCHNKELSLGRGASTCRRTGVRKCGWCGRVPQLLRAALQREGSAGGIAQPHLPVRCTREVGHQWVQVITCKYQ